MKEYFQLQNVLRDGAVISEVKEEKNRIYFKIDGKQFQTYSSYVYGEGAPLYNHPVSDIWARKHNTAEGIAEEEERMEKLDKEIELYQKHEASLYKLIFLRALEIGIDEGNEKMLKYIHYHFDIMENDDHCQKLLNRLENEL